jgi:hypothetical protein
MLSNSIYFFHDISSNKKDEQLTNLRITANADSTEVVHHIVSSNFFSLNEIANADKIRALNDHFIRKRFYIFDTVERLQITEILEDSDMDMETGIINSNTNKLLLTFEKCHLTYLDVHLKSLSCSKRYIFQLIEFYRYLFGSIDLLVCNKIVHNNINFNTIVVDGAFNLPVLTNFMYSIDVSLFQRMLKYFKQYFLLKKLSIFSPVEFYLLQYQLTNNLSSLSLYNIETVLKQFIKDHSMFLTVLNDDKNLLDDGLKFFARYTNKSFDESLVEIFKYCWTWDNYALSIVYLKIMIGLHRLVTGNKFIISFMKLLVDNIRLDPSKRPLPNISSFEDLLKTIELVDFKQLVDLL